ncbi:hypothetical protein KAR91_31390 [Candidatus Pacearchaeota archaeon]|nr:hypothetical protein [Candidatus Pacearchaeota archaeon]
MKEGRKILIMFPTKLIKNIEKQVKKEDRPSFTNTVTAILNRFFEEQEKKQ